MHLHLHATTSLFAKLMPACALVVVPCTMQVQQLLLAGDDTSLAALSKCLKERPELIGNSRCSAPNASATLFTLAAQSGRIRALELLHGMFLSPQCPYAHLPQQELHAKLRKRMDAGDSLGRTPLHHACAMGHADVVVWLLDKVWASLRLYTTCGMHVCPCGCTTLLGGGRVC